MKTTRALAELGQSLWLDNITRPLLDGGTLAALHRRARRDGPDLEPHDLRPRHRRLRRVRRARSPRRRTPARRARTRSSSWRSPTCAAPPTCSARSTTARDGVDGFVSLEVSPLLAYDTAATVAQAKRLHALGDRPNLFIKIPGTPEGLPAIEEAIFAGVPVNVTLLFSPGPVPRLRRGLHARHRAPRRRPGCPPSVASVASLFVSRWDPATADAAPGRHAERAGPRHRPPELRRLPRVLRRPSAGSGSWPRAPARSACCSRAPGPRTRRCRRRCTSPASRPRTPSTRCPRRRSWPPARPSEPVDGADGRTPPDQLARFAAAGVDVDAVGRRAPAQGRRSPSWRRGPRSSTASPPRSSRSRSGRRAARRTMRRWCDSPDGLDVEGPVQAELFVVWLRGDRLELTGPCGAAPWLIELGESDHPVEAVTPVVRDVVGEPLLVHSTSWRRERAARHPELRRRDRRRAGRHDGRACRSSGATSLAVGRPRPTRDRLRAGRGARPAAHGVAREGRSGRRAELPVALATRPWPGTCPSRSGTSADRRHPMSDDALTVRCACGWETTGAEARSCAATDRARPPPPQHGRDARAGPRDGGARHARPRACLPGAGLRAGRPSRTGAVSALEFVPSSPDLVARFAACLPDEPARPPEDVRLPGAFVDGWMFAATARSCACPRRTRPSCWRCRAPGRSSRCPAAR